MTNSKLVSSLMMMVAEVVLETLVCLPFNHLTQLLAWEHFTEFSYLETRKLGATNASEILAATCLYGVTSKKTPLLIAITVRTLNFRDFLTYIDQCQPTCSALRTFDKIDVKNKVKKYFRNFFLTYSLRNDCFNIYKNYLYLTAEYEPQIRFWSSTNPKTAIFAVIQKQYMYEALI